MGFTLVTETECICPGQTLTFECRVIGTGVTVLHYQGSLINCENSISGDILLLHSRYTNGTRGELKCNGGAIKLVGRSVRVEDNCYISQLQMKFNDFFVESQVRCEYDNGIDSRLVANYSIPSFNTIGDK